jgi:2-polyprenyl-6-methoxyphenol hydroxylase-like FAD-dependent oxidoreductase
VVATRIDCREYKVFQVKLRRTMSATQVLIIGAGPTGLVLAFWLTRLGIRVRLVDKTAAPGTTSRAIVVHARTLEFYRQLGLSDEVVRHGREFIAANLWVKGHRAGRVEFGTMGLGLSPFPYALIYPQDEHEKLLIERLAQAGVVVERSTECLHFEERGDRVLARLRRTDGSEESCAAQYIAGCDGAHSTVREILGVGFPGGTYAHVFYVADVVASGPVMNGELHVALDEADFVGVFPLRTTGHARLIGTVRNTALDNYELSWDDVSRVAIERLGIKVQHVNWFSTYRVHHRVALRFRQGRAFLLGDAAHIHSPVGGQGMNTGIGDAVNLAWKLGAVLQGGAEPRLLDTYEPERIAFARRLVETTDRAFTLVTSPGRLARFIRVAVVPRVLPILFRSRRVRRVMFRTVSQIAINYHASPLSQGAAGGVKAGDRLPWVRLQGALAGAQDNFEPLKSLDWQAQVYGTCSPSVAEFCSRLKLALYCFPWESTIKAAGIKKGALYLVRPDGYLGLADRDANLASLEQYVQEHSLRFGGK